MGDAADATYLSAFLQGFLRRLDIFHGAVDSLLVGLRLLGKDFLQLLGFTVRHDRVKRRIGR